MLSKCCSQMGCEKKQNMIYRKPFNTPNRSIFSNSCTLWAENGLFLSPINISGKMQ